MAVSTDPPDWLTSDQTARHLNVSVETVRRYARTGVLRAHRLYGRGRLRFLLDDVERLLDPPSDREEAA